MIYYLKNKPNASGAYPAPQAHPGPGTIPIREDQRDMVVQYSGFVTLSQKTDKAGAVSYTIEPNTEAWEAWKKEMEALPPEPVPPTVEELEAKVKALTQTNKMLEDCLVEMAGVVYA